MKFKNLGSITREMERLGQPNFWSSLLLLFYVYVPLKIRPWLVKLTKRYRMMDAIVDNNVLKSNGRHPYLIDQYNRRTPQEITKHQMSIEPLPKYLHYEDRMSMAHSVESRVPFLDYRLVEFTRTLPLEYLDDDNEPKKILAHSLSSLLPPAIRNRKDKKGFITPEQRWFKEDFYNEFLQLLRDNVHYAKGIVNPQAAEQYFNDVREGKTIFTYTYWHILSFCLWMKVFNVQLEYNTKTSKPVA
jgi:asparagine synthase (glutamine-hydrolysing)